MTRDPFIALEGRPLFQADWERVLFVHYRLPAPVLQPHVPFELDLCEGSAWVSLVFFTMTGLRPAWGGPLVSWLFRPVREQRFLNVRTYVRHGEERGIHFLVEWISNRLCVSLGPVLYSLPYQWGRHRFWHATENSPLNGRVESPGGDGAFAYEGTLLRTAAAASPVFTTCLPGSREDFLLERYAAFNRHRGPARMFRIWHEPWRQCPATLSVQDESLLVRHAPWWRETAFEGAHYSPGAYGVWMGRPHRVLLPSRMFPTLRERTGAMRE